MALTLHQKARSKHPAYPDRTHVPDELVAWERPWPEYSPVLYTANSVKANDRSIKVGGWADPQVMAKEDLLKRLTYHGKIVLDDRGWPRNPVGRTGMAERGLLGKWGPNHAADPIVTRLNPDTKKFEMVAIKRKDTGEWAIPGGMVDDGELVSATLKREFAEEAMGNHNLDDQSKQEIKQQLDILFSQGGVEVYKGYVDDPRNTDNAWMETVAMHFHCNDELGARLYLEAADDAQGVMWLQIQDNRDGLSKLYASHQTFVLKALDRLMSLPKKNTLSNDVSHAPRSRVPYTLSEPAESQPVTDPAFVMAARGNEEYSQQRLLESSEPNLSRPMLLGVGAVMVLIVVLSFSFS